MVELLDVIMQYEAENGWKPNLNYLLKFRSITHDGNNNLQKRLWVIKEYTFTFLNTKVETDIIYRILWDAK